MSKIANEMIKLADELSGEVRTAKWGVRKFKKSFGAEINKVFKNNGLTPGKPYSHGRSSKSSLYLPTIDGPQYEGGVKAEAHIKEGTTNRGASQVFFAYTVWGFNRKVYGKVWGVKKFQEFLRKLDSEIRKMQKKAQKEFLSGVPTIRDLTKEAEKEIVGLLKRNGIYKSHGEIEEQWADNWDEQGALGFGIKIGEFDVPDYLEVYVFSNYEMGKRKGKKYKTLYTFGLTRPMVPKGAKPGDLIEVSKDEKDYFGRSSTLKSMLSKIEAHVEVTKLWYQLHTEYEEDKVKEQEMKLRRQEKRKRDKINRKRREKRQQQKEQEQE